MKYETISIKDIIQMLNEKRVYLPEIQRSFVWKAEQIEKLFESIFIGYPIGTLLFWKTTKNDINKNEIILYDFIKDYHERDSKNNDKSSTIASDYENYFITLDGQQRLTALYIGLQGSTAYKTHNTWWKLDDSFPKKKLYFNLDAKGLNDDDDDEIIPIFKFFEDGKVPKNNKWIIASDILKFNDLNDIIRYTNNNELTDEESGNISKFWGNITSINPPIIHYLNIESDSYEDVLNIFVRLNSYGTPLSKSDLLFSTMLLEWKGGRETIEKLIKDINNKGNKFNFSKDFIMRTCLVLSGASVNLKIDSFKKDKIIYIRDNFERISLSIKKAVDSLVKLGYSDEMLSSQNALIPYIYYLYKGGNEKNITGLKKYLAVSQLKNLYGVASNAALTSTRAALEKLNCKKVDFDITLFDGVILVGDRDFKIREDDINSYMDKEKGKYTFYILSLLYPNLKLDQVKFHQDHAHPYNSFENLDKDKLTKEQIDRWKILRDTLPNLELLEGSENESKNDMSLTDWINKGNKVEYSDEKESTDLYNFDNYYKKRKEKMITELKRIFDVK